MRVHASADGILGVGFRVEFDGSLQGSFTECSGFEITVAVEKFEEGGLNDHEHQLPGRTSYGNVTLKQPVLIEQKFYDWLLQIVRGEAARKELSIYVGDSAGERVRSWQLKGAWPVKWTGPSMKTGGNEAAIETIEIAHEGLVELR